MPNQSLFTAMLENSKTEQLPVDIYLTNHLISGIVTSMNEQLVELRIHNGKRCAVALDKIEAITIA
jgi:host factor-I protein